MLLNLLDGEINTTVDLVLARKGNGRMYAVSVRDLTRARLP